MSCWLAVCLPVEAVFEVLPVLLELVLLAEGAVVSAPVEALLVEGAEATTQRGSVPRSVALRTHSSIQ